MPPQPLPEVERRRQQNVNLVFLKALEPTPI